mgnify:CR=1 FL=1
MSVEVTYTHKCDKCGKTHSKTYPVYQGSDIPKPHKPDGWHRYDNGYICDDHIITVSEPTGSWAAIPMSIIPKEQFDLEWANAQAHMYDVMVSTNKDIVGQILNGLIRSDGYCPCVPPSLHIDDVKCPCISLRNERMCRCGLFDKKTE